jgi:hypothetical protein
MGKNGQVGLIALDQHELQHCTWRALVCPSNGYCFTRGRVRPTGTFHVATTSASRIVGVQQRLAPSADLAENKADGCKQELGSHVPKMIKGSGFVESFDDYALHH